MKQQEKILALTALKNQVEQVYEDATNLAIKFMRHDINAEDTTMLYKARIHLDKALLYIQTAEIINISNDKL